MQTSDAYSPATLTEAIDDAFSFMVWAGSLLPFFVCWVGCMITSS